MAKSSSRSSSVSDSSGGDASSEQKYKRLKLESSSEIEGSPTSDGVVSSGTSAPPSIGTKTQAAFVNKLYKMLEDPETSDLIAWSSHGDLFSVSNPTAFSRTVLPQYFKHNNWQSFVRQLNMYGFHKVNDLIHSNLTNENQTWEFKHPHFRRGAVGDLQHIKRKSAKSQQVQLQLQLQQQQQQQQEQEEQLQQQHRMQQKRHQEQEEREEEQQRRQEKQEDWETTKVQDVSNHNTGNDNNSHINEILDVSDEQDELAPVIKHVLRIENHLLGVTKTCEQLFNEVVHLRMVVSKQQDAMQDLVDVVSSSAKNNNCNCNSSNNNNNNNQELQNAENLRIQVSKLKESQHNYGNQNYTDTYSNNSGSTSSNAYHTNTNESSSWSPIAPTLPFNKGSAELSQSPNIKAFQSQQQQQQNDTSTQRRLDNSITLQQKQLQSSYRLDNTSNNNNNNYNSGRFGATTTKEPQDSLMEEPTSTLNRKSSSSSSISSTASHQRYNPYSEENKARSSKMSFGKQSHMLNPIDGKRKHKRKSRAKHRTQKTLIQPIGRVNTNQED